MVALSRNFQNKPVLVKTNTDHILRILGRSVSEGADLSGWKIYETNFPKGTSLHRCNLENAELIECGLGGCDFTDAVTKGIVLDHSTIEMGENRAVGLDLSTVASTDGLNPYNWLARTNKLEIPLRRREPSAPCLAKLS
ncbi:MAG: pentapeptide repeat-containing protein [Micavibrio sp.]